MDAPVYMNWGRWVAECPSSGCGDAVALYPQHPRTGEISPTPVYVQRCANGHEFRLDAPPDDIRARIEIALAERLSGKCRNWFPKNHPLAIASGQPHGQSVDDLRREAEAGEAADADALAGRRAALLAQMKEFGITPDEALAVLKGV